MAAGAIGTVASGALGSGRRVGRVGVDPNLYALGGDPNYARDRTADFQGMGRDAYGRRIINNTGTNDALADARAARAGQDRLAGRLTETLEGRGPSVAELQLRQGTRQAATNALNVAANARGGNYANAAIAAQDTNAVQAAEANSQAAVLRAQEQAQARQELASLYNAQRQGDFAAAGAAQGAEALTLQERQLNDAQYNQMVDAELQLNRDALGGTMAYGQADLTAGLQAQRINAELEEAARQRRAAFWGGLLKGGSDLLAKKV